MAYYELEVPVTGRSIGNNRIVVGMEADNLVTELRFGGLPVLADAQTASLLWATTDDITPAGGDVITLTIDGTAYVCAIPSTITQFAARTISAFIRVTDGTAVWNSKPFIIAIQSTPDVTVIETPENISAIEQMVLAIQAHTAAMAETLQDAQEARTAAEAASGQTDEDAQATAADRQAVAQDKAMTAGYKEAAQASATEAGEQADEAERQAGIAQNNILNGITTHNGSDAAHLDIRQLIRDAIAIATGRATSYTFDTRAHLDAWLIGEYVHPDGITPDILVRGDNLWIEAHGIENKDQWWTGTALSPLETESPDLANYYQKTQIDAMLPIVISRSAYEALPSPDAGRLYDVYED